MGRFHTEAIAEEGLAAWFMGRSARQRAARDDIRGDLRRTNRDISQQLGMSARAAWAWTAFAPVSLVAGWWMGSLWGVALALWLVWALYVLLRWRHRRAQRAATSEPAPPPPSASGMPSVPPPPPLARPPRPSGDP